MARYRAEIKPRALRRPVDFEIFAAIAEPNRHRLADADAQGAKELRSTVRSRFQPRVADRLAGRRHHDRGMGRRSEEHTSELQSLMRLSYDVFCLKKKNNKQKR